METTEELRPSFVCAHVLAEPMIDFARFSKFERLKRTVAYVHRYMDNLRRVVTGVPRETGSNLGQEELQKAEVTLWKLAQLEAYPDEVAALKQNKEKGTKLSIESSSKLANLPPMIDDQDVLRVDGRLDAADCLTFDAKYPVILPREHRLTELVINWYHDKYRHANDETILNEIRQKFFVSKLRASLRKTKSRCMWCRVHKSIPVPPKMGPLPKVRLTPFVRAFTFVGIDYFGPYLVKVGRSVAKRWGVVFTCLTIRAIHIEVACSLSADSCKKAIRRFIARRGAPQEIYSDNGTNFIGVSRELAKELAEINSELGNSITDTYTKWRFNPPSAPHMGGCWERMVRSIKTALEVIPIDRKLDDESLATMFLEAERMINSRPLTFVSLATSDDEAITPNHFLLLSSSGVQQPVKLPVDEKQALRSSWDMIQRTLDRMWRRWITEYLPTIARRTKWFKGVRTIKEGDLVVIADEKVRNRWLRGRVARVYPGKDGTIRKADVMTTGGILSRAVAKLALLDVEPKDDAGSEVQAT